MIPKIADRANPFLPGRIASHDERISVVESEFRRHPDAEFGQLFSHLIQRRARGLENFLRDRAGVFRIRRDLVTLERLPKNDGSAHALPVVDRHAGFSERAFRDLRQDIGFGEFLRADKDGLGVCETAKKTKRNRSYETYTSYEGSPDHDSVTDRCAVIKSPTNAFAGRARRSLNVPRCTTRPSFMSTISSPR